MKKIAIGILAAATILTAAPAMAQVGFYAGPGGVGIVGQPGPYYNYGYPRDRAYYDYYGGPGVAIGVGPGWHRGWHHDHWHR